MVGLFDMRMYDLLLVLKTTLSDSERNKFVDTVKDWIKGAKEVKEESLGQKVLSYTIKKEAAGFFVKVSFQGDTLPLLDVSKRLLQNENVLRHLLIRNK